MTRAIVVFIAALGLAGCNPKEDVKSASDTVSLSLFKEGKGVRFSDQTRSLLGLDIAEVVEMPVAPRIERTAQVYRNPGQGGRAGAVLPLASDEARQLKVGQTCTLKSSVAIPGTLVRVDSQLQCVSGQVEALIEFSDPEQRFPLGTLVSVVFTNGESRRVLVIPESALLIAADGHSVYTVNEGYLTRTPVKTGTADGGFLEIQDGLYAGDSVAVKGVQNLWLVELSALKGGTPCCPVPKNKASAPPK